ncbi:hypothetical protein [Yersinia pseudotuberculosis]
MDLFTASLRSACSPSRGHFVNNLRAAFTALGFAQMRLLIVTDWHT